MSKKKKNVIALDTMIKTSVQKLNIVCDLIRKKKALDAVIQMQFCKRSVSTSVLKVLKSAIANSTNNYSYNVDKMYIKHIIVGKSISLKRSIARARGKNNRIIKPYSRLLIELEEREV